VTAGFSSQDKSRLWHAEPLDCAPKPQQKRRSSSPEKYPDTSITTNPAVLIPNRTGSVAHGRVPLWIHNPRTCVSRRITKRIRTNTGPPSANGQRTQQPLPHEGNEGIKQEPDRAAFAGRIVERREHFFFELLSKTQRMPPDQTLVEIPSIMSISGANLLFDPVWTPRLFPVRSPDPVFMQVSEPQPIQHQRKFNEAVEETAGGKRLTR
jgi:hypothetical protein